MFRKNLVASACTIAALSFTAQSFAHINYQRDSWRDSEVATRISNLYLGIQGAYVDSNWSDMAGAFESGGLFTTDFNDAEFAGRVFARWDFSKYFGIEGGFSYIDGSEYTFAKPAFDGEGEPVIDPESMEQVLENVLREKNTVTIVDLTWVTRVPLQDKFMFYMKFGADYVRVKNGFKVRTFQVEMGEEITSVTTVTGRDQSNVSFTFGLGFNYQFCDNLFGDLSWQHFRGNDVVGDFIADHNLFMAGVSYRIQMGGCKRSCL